MTWSRDLSRRVLATLTVVLSLALVVQTPAAAQDDDQDIAAIDIEVLRSPIGAELVPVRVTVVSRRAIEADLVISSEASNISWELPLALAANNEISQLVAVPATPGFFGQLDASLVADGERIADAEDNLESDFEQAIGVLGVAAPGPDLQLQYGLGLASAIELNDLTLLSALDTLVASPAGLASLTDVERTQLLGWLATGRQLIVTDAPGAADEFLPVAWRGDGSAVTAEAGIIRYRPDDWATQVPPSPGLSVDIFAFEWFDASPRELISDGGFRVPGIGIVALVLLGYVLVAGPVAFAILSSRNRQNLAWVVVPALALLFTLGVFGVGRAFNAGRSDAYATIAEFHPAGMTVRDTILLADSGSQQLELPQGWYLSTTALNQGPNGGAAGASTIVRPSRITTDLEFGIEAGSAGTGIVVGTDATQTAQLEISDLVVRDDLAIGTVENRSGVDLENVTALVGHRSAVIGTVADGASAEFEVRLNQAVNRLAPELRPWDVDPRDGDFFNEPFGRNDRGDSAVETGPSNGQSWLNYRSQRFGTSAPEGSVTVVGWSRDLDYSIVDGRGRTAVVARAPLPASGEPLAVGQIRRLVFGASGISQGRFGPEPFGPDGFGSAAVAQFIAPAGGDPSGLALEVPPAVRSVEVWVEGDGWRGFALEGFNGSSVVLPEQAWNDGVLTVRFQVDQFFGQLVVPELEPMRNQSEALELAPAGEVPKRAAEFNDGFEPGFGPVVFGQDWGIFQGEAGVEEGVSGELFGTYDVLTIELTEGDVIDLRMTHFGTGLDPFLVLLDPDGSVVAENDDDGNSTNSQIVHEVDTTGAYVIEARPLDGSGAGPYELTWFVEAGGE